MKQKDVKIMAGMQFEYDEEGGTFFYFLLSFWGLVLIPCTYYFWPRKQESGKIDRSRECKCDPCRSKKQKLKSGTKWQSTKNMTIKIALFIGWIIFILLAYKVSKIQLEYVEYDPYAELEIDRGASQKEIKKAYRQQSLKYHPDKETGDHRKFMRIAKAYAALTDEETKKNWEEYGNPDGPGVTKFGIALPKWIIEQENSAWVLAAYGLVFMVIMPVAVGIWWYRSIKYSKDEVLLDTTRLYYYFFQKVPNMMLKRVIMVLGASFEFDRFHNQEISERPSDNEEVPQKNKEKPLCFPYSVKARALLHAHFMRLDLPPNTLEIAIRYMPRLETVENCMKVSQMVFQALDQKSSPLLQLPHITPEMLKHFVTRKRNIQRIRDFIQMKEDDKRALLRNLTNEEYRDILNVCASLPYVRMVIKSEVLDDEDSSITAGSIVTVTVELERKKMEVLFDKESAIIPGDDDDNNIQEEDQEEMAVDENTSDSPAKNTGNKAKVWEKQKKKDQATTGTESSEQKVEEENDGSGLESEEEPTNQSDAEETEASSKGDNTETHHDEEEQWKKYQEEAKKEQSLETKAKESHPEKQEGWWLYVSDKKNHIFSLSFQHQPDQIQLKFSAPARPDSAKLKFSAPARPGLYTYTIQLKFSAPARPDSAKIQLKFSAPARPGLYTYTVCFRSDCYFDFDQSQNIKLDVKEAKVIEADDHWEISDDEEDKDKEEDSDSDYSTDADDSDY
ncbi:hypothetical protein KUTeg_007496 [Tegillarca granosa]|uniref:J domain-containing protein n=1 Tax=Tegillarca granosa TaxID=220873 RepID=A0ABQ9FFE1_TEGGR|nr:hypothetical protein KUTeg_007496 [Tegillarca granosa]